MAKKSSRDTSTKPCGKASISLDFSEFIPVDAYLDEHASEVVIVTKSGQRRVKVSREQADKLAAEERTAARRAAERLRKERDKGHPDDSECGE